MREDRVYKIEVHVAGICFWGDKVLIVKRNSKRRLYPNLWECGGGQVRNGENFEEALIRGQREELGVEIKPLRMLKNLGTYEIITNNPEQSKIPGVKIFCEIVGFARGKEPEITDEHSEWKFISKAEIGDYEFIPGLKDEIREAYGMIEK
jgi:ADP-ribose pyrophosphatase YjhB (NUDIX family)